MINHQHLDLPIIAHCVDVDLQNVADSSRDPEGGRFRGAWRKLVEGGECCWAAVPIVREPSSRRR